MGSEERHEKKRIEKAASNPGRPECTKSDLKEKIPWGRWVKTVEDYVKAHHLGPDSITCRAWEDIQKEPTLLEAKDTRTEGKSAHLLTWWSGG